MAGALRRVKNDLGRDAVILHTRTYKQGSVLGLGGRNVVEITATVPSDRLPPTRAPVRIPKRSSERAANASAAAGRPASWPNTAGTSTSKAATEPPQAAAGPQFHGDLRGELTQIRSLVEQVIDETRKTGSGQVPAELLDTYTRLVQQQVADELARELLDDVRQSLTGEQLRDAEAVQARLAQRVAEMIPEAGPIEIDGPPGRAKVVALVGPTGVGKTTTIAKLAAHFKLREHKNVGLITIDTYRIAAVDQLKTYARIVDVPLEVVLSPAELVDAVQQMRQMDLILIDTAGRSQNDTIRLNELKSFLSAIETDEIHLVLSSTATAGTLRSAIERFGELGADRIIFTKLDEAVGFGVILDAVRSVDSRLSYVTTGQDVPDDIAVGSAREVARLILGSTATLETQPDAARR